LYIVPPSLDGRYDRDQQLHQQIRPARGNRATRTLRTASELRNAVEHERLREVNGQFSPLTFTHILSGGSVRRSFAGGEVPRGKEHFPRSGMRIAAEVAAFGDRPG